MRLFLLLLISFLYNSVLAQTYLMTDGSATTCAGTFYDSGGAGGSYGNSENFTYTICPDTPGSMVSLDFTAFAVETGWDVLCVFNGPTTGSPSFGCYDSGTPLLGIVQSTDPSGCLTFQFTSDGSVTPAGWEASISCTMPCQSVIADPSFSIATDPIMICQGDAVDFFGDGIYPESGTGYVQSDATSTFTWSIKDNSGTTTLVGEDQTVTFPDPGIYIVSLEVEDIEGCSSTNATTQEIWVSTTPIFTGTTPVLPDICLGETNDLLGVATPPTEILDCTPPVTGTTPLPDGSGVSYSTSVEVDCYTVGSTITDASEIESICITMEHSYAGDLDIEIQCPDGTTISLVDYLGPGLDWEFIGEPVDDDLSATVGVGYTYCWTEGPSATESWADVGVIPPTYTYTDADGTLVTDHEYIPGGDYLPADPFSGLVGCPVNGDWTIIITDNLASDDGTIFDWSIDFTGIPTLGTSTFTPTIVDYVWTPAGEIVSTSGSDATVLPITDGVSCYTLTVEDDFGCFYDTSVCFTVHPSPLVDDIPDVTACDSYTLPAITGTDLTGGEGYFTGASGTGASFSAGDVITATTSLFIYDAMAAPPNCSSEEDFTITIIISPDITPIADVIACDSYTLPAIGGSNLTGNEAYFTGPGGTGTSYLPGTVITSSISPLYIYDATATTPICFDQESFNITINITPVAGPDNSATLCNTVGTTLDLDGLLVGADAGGTWTETSVPASLGFTAGTGVLDASDVAPGVYTFEYTVSGGAPCPDDVAEITITINDDPNAGVDNSSTICNSAGSTIDLDGLVDPAADAGGTWAETTGTPSGAFTPGTGVLDGSGVTPGVYTFEYTVTGIAPCLDDVAEMTITVNDAPTAGADNASTLCNTAGSTIDLDGLLVGADAGGTWAETTASGAFTPGTGVFDASGLAAGDYTFEYTVTGLAPCPDDVAEMTITVNDAPTAGADNASTLCNTAGSTIDLDGLLIGADAGGAWAETSASGAFTPGTGVFDASGLAAGDYTFEYTVTGLAPCPDDVAEMTITVNDAPTAGADNASTLCNTAGSTIDLDGLLIGADAGGAWAETSASGAFTPGTGVFDASGLAAGDYTFEYTVTGIAPCPDDVAEMTITVNDAPTAGADNSSTLCNTAGSTIDLDGLLIGADAGGTWAETTASGAFTPGTGVFDASGLAAGDYTFEYTVTGLPPCPDDVAEMTITVNDAPIAGPDNSATLCNTVGTTLDLNTLLVGADAGGTWVETSVPASLGFTAGTGTLDASSVAAGTYTFEYTVTGIAPCPDDVAEITITINDQPDAGADNSSVICNTAGSTIDLNTLLDPAADAGGTWAETTASGAFTPGTGVFDASGLAAGTYDFTYTVTGTAPCVDDVADFSITVTDLPNAGADNAAALCNSAGTTLDLNTLLDATADAGGTWSETSGTPSLGFTPGTGVLDASGVAAGTYTFVYDIPAVGPCPGDFATMTITIEEEVNAGADNAAALCNAAGTTLDLNTLLDATADAGGTWTETSGTPSGAFTPGTGVLDASGVTAGTYTFEYTVTAVAPCVDDVAIMTITIEQEVNAGADNAAALCNSAGTTLDLNTLLDATADAGGTWTETSGTPSGAFTPGTGVLDASGVTAGTYTFEYTVTAVAPCVDDVATMTITIEQEVNAGADNAAALCNSAGTTLDLNTLLDATADAGGTWTETSGTPSGAFTPGTGVLDASGVTAGTYTFDYTVTAVAPCVDDVATMTITIEQEAIAGADNSAVMCNTAGSTLDLNTLLDAIAAAGGTWAETTASGAFTPGTGIFDASGLAAGTYDFTYTVTGTAPCVDDVADFSITVTDLPNAGADNAAALCNSAGTTLDLNTLLDATADAGGTWSETSGTPSLGFTPGTGVLDASGVAAGTYTFVYDIPAVGPCPGDFATMTITIEEEVNAGADNAAALCNVAGTTLDLNTLLDATADAGGAWTETSGTPSGAFTPGTGVLDASGVTAGTYTFEYTVTAVAPCVDDVAIMTITIEQEVNAGADNAAALCNVAGTTLDLNTLLDATADAGGAWTETSGTPSGAFTPGTGVLDASGVTAGTYTFEYTVTAVAPCVDDVAIMTITIEQEVNAGADNAAALCNSAGTTLDLNTLLDATADAGGAWTETSGTPSGAFTPGTGVLDASGVTAGTYTFDYTVTAVAPCVDDVATMTITIEQEAIAGADNSAVMCNTAGSTLDLNTLLDAIAAAGGTWAETTASGAFTPGTGIFDASGLAAGTYDFTYTVTGTAPCVDDVADFSITVTDLPNAGADNAAALCNSAGTTLDLNTLLDATADAGGTWSETSGTPSLGFTPGTGVLDASGVAAGTYTFVYDIPAVGPCPGDFATMTITIEEEVNAGADNAAALCNVAGTTLDLNTLLDATADAGGTWTETSGTPSGAFTPGTGVLDASGVTAGTYTFEYTVTAVAPCVDDVAIMTITIEQEVNAGADNAAALCNSAGTTLDLNTLLDATADAGGAWTETSGTPSGAFTPGTGVLDASGVTAGTYTFEYTVTAVAPCVDDVAIMTITIEQEVNAGADNAAALCNSAGTTLDLNTLLDATADAGGAWTETSGTPSGAFTPGTGVLDASGVTAGTYTFDYTVTAVAPCVDDVATMTITIEQEAIAGADNSAVMCNTAGSTLDLNTLLDAIAAAGGTWAETTASGAFTPGTGIFDASGLAAGTYDFTYTVTGTAPCVDDVADFSITVTDLPNAGADNAAALCNSAGTTLDLNTLLDATADAGGTWSETSGTPSLGFTPGTGVLDASGVAAGTYTFVYDIPAVGPCPGDFATMTITIEEEVNAGADNAAALCNAAGTTLDLNTLLDATADAGGAWTETSGTPSGAFTPGTGVLDASGVTAGTYTFEYTVTGVAPCVDDVAIMTITIEQEVNAGADNAAALCNVAGTTLDLNTLLDATADAGGAWTETSGTPSGAFTPGTGVLDASGVTAGTYTFEYTVTAVAPCVDDVAIMTITIEQEVNAGADNAAALCNSAGTTLDLNTLLDATADAGGTWTETSGTPSGAFTPGTGVLDASGVTAGTYTFDYTVTAVAPCVDDVATMTITIEQEVNAGADNVATMCNSAGSTLDLNTLLDATADLGGTWVETSGTPSGSFTPGTGVLDASGLTAGDYTFTYSLTAVAPCVDDMASFTISVTDLPFAGADNAQSLCNSAGTTLDLNTLLDATADAGGTWSETSGTPSLGFTPGTGVLDASGVAAGTYTFVYDIPAVGPCPGDFATMTITIEEEVNAGADNAAALCNAAGTTLDLNTLLDATADAGGAWTETSGTPSGAFTPGTGVLDASGVTAGTYTFDYTVTGVAPCVDDVAIMTITIEQEVNAGADNAAALCNSAGTTLDLNTLLDATADAGGAWTETSGTPSGAFTPGTGVLDASGVTAGTYTFEYTVTAVAPCVDDVAIMTITIEQEVNAGADNAAALCNSAGTTLDLNTLLDATADAGGAWTETSGTPSGAFTPGTGVLDASGVTAGTYTFDYTVTAVAPCVDDVATMTITIEQEVNAGADNVATMCNSAGSTLDLNTLLDATADLGGTWVETSGTPSGSFTPGTGVLDASGLTAGDYTFTYSLTAVAPCVDDMASFTISVTDLPFAGADNAQSLCNSAGTTLDLNTLVDPTADAGGTWSETSGTPSLGFTPGTGVLDASGVAAGTYTFVYDIPAVGPCPGDFATMTITIEEEVNAGADNAAALCNAAGTTLDLNTLLDATADAGGTWTETSGTPSGAFTPGTGVLDASGVTAGTYTFEYTVTAVAPCVDDVAIMTITIEQEVNAGADNAAALCNSAGTTLDLNTLLDATADAGGAWTETSGTPSGAFTPGTGVLDASGVTAGTYTFEYTVTAVAPCVDDVATMTITIEQEVNAGADNAAALCNSAGTTLDLNTLLDATADAGGTWTETSGTPSGAFTPGTGVLDASGVTAGTYTFDYTVTAVAPCVDDVATMTITIEQAVNAGGDNTAALCNTAGTTIDLNTLLIGADTGGNWSETTLPASGSFTPASGVFDASGLAGGDYTFNYEVVAIAPCTNDNAAFTITVNEMPVVDPIADLSICADDDLAVPAFGSSIPGSTFDWTLTTGTDVGFGFAGIGNIGTFTAINPTDVDVIANVAVVATAPGGCVSLPVDFDITVHPLPAVNFTADTLIGCIGLEVNFTNLTVPAGVDCQWEFGDGSTASGCAGVSHVYASDGLYDVTLTVTTAEGCSSSFTVNDYITVAPYPVAAFTYYPDYITVSDTEVEFENTSINADFYTWDFGDFTPPTAVDNPTHEFPNNGGGSYTVTLIAESAAGCPDTTSQIITVEDVLIFYVPNAFTPDGNDVNQTFYPVITAGIDVYDYHLTIFNRWGEIIFESYDTTVGWDGTYGGQGLVDDGVYVWQIEFGDTMSDKKHKHRGHVTVLK